MNQTVSTQSPTGLVIANFMDSSLHDLAKKGVFDSVAEIYNPGGAYARVIHFTPHRQDEEIGDALALHGIEIRSHDAGGLSPLKILRTVFSVWRTIGKEHVDLVRGRLPYLGSLIGGTAAVLRRRPFVVSLGGDNRIAQQRNNQYYYNSRWISYGMEWLVLRLATAIIVPNRFSAAYVAQIIGQRLADKKCVRIPWISLPAPANEEPVIVDEFAGGNQPLVLIVGFLNRYKFTDILFDFLEIAFRDGSGLAPRAHYVFCGDGPLLDEGRDRFADNPNVSFLGWTPQAKVRALMQRSDIVFVPMSGFVLLEAAALGKPVVTSNIEWHSELVTDGEAGLVIQPDDVSAWRSATERLLRNDEAAQRMGLALQQRFLDEYAPEKCIAAEINLYRDLVDRVRP